MKSLLWTCCDNEEKTSFTKKLNGIKKRDFVYQKWLWCWRQKLYCSSFFEIQTYFKTLLSVKENFKENYKKEQLIPYKYNSWECLFHDISKPKTCYYSYEFHCMMEVWELVNGNSFHKSENFPIRLNSIHTIP